MLSRNQMRSRGVAPALHMTSSEEAYLKEEYARQMSDNCARGVGGNVGVGASGVLGTHEVADVAPAQSLARLLADLTVIADGMSNLESRVYGFNARVLGHVPVAGINGADNPEPPVDCMMDKLNVAVRRMFYLLDALNNSTARLGEIA